MDNFFNAHPLQEVAEGMGLEGPWHMEALTVDPTETAERARHNREFWKQFLTTDRSIMRSYADWEYARRLAGEWNTCACGSINDGLPRLSRSNWEPQDGLLQSLGLEFYYAVGEKDLPRCREAFKAIQIQGRKVLLKLGGDYG